MGKYLVFHRNGSASNLETMVKNKKKKIELVSQILVKRKCIFQKKNLSFFPFIFIIM